MTDEICESLERLAEKTDSLHARVVAVEVALERDRNMVADRISKEMQLLRQEIREDIDKMRSAMWKYVLSITGSFIAVILVMTQMTASTHTRLENAIVEVAKMDTENRQQINALIEAFRVQNEFNNREHLRFERQIDNHETKHNGG